MNEETYNEEIELFLRGELPTEEAYNEEIELFLKGELPTLASLRIRRQIKNDPKFRETVRFHQLVLEGINHTIDKDVAQFVKPPKEDLPAAVLAGTTSEAIRRPLLARRHIRAISGVVAILLTLFVGWEFVLPWANQQQHINDSLNSELNVNLGVASENDELLAQAQQAFNGKDFETASSLFETYLQRDSIDNPEFRLYQGMAFRLSDQAEKAISIFTELIDTRHQHYSGEEASWQLALSYLQQENYDACRQQLNAIIANKACKKRDQAKDLKRSIRFK